MIKPLKNDYSICVSDVTHICYVTHLSSNKRGFIWNEIFAPGATCISLLLEEEISDNNINWSIDYKDFENPEYKKPETYVPSDIGLNAFTLNINFSNSEE